MKQIWILAGLAALGLTTLSACTTPQQLAAEQAQMDRYDDQQCQQLGFRPGNEAYGNCRLKMREIRATQGSGSGGPNISLGLGYAHGF